LNKNRLREDAIKGNLAYKDISQTIDGLFNMFGAKRPSGNIREAQEATKEIKSLNRGLNIYLGLLEWQIEFERYVQERIAVYGRKRNPLEKEIYAKFVSVGNVMRDVSPQKLYSAQNDIQAIIKDLKASLSSSRKTIDTGTELPYERKFGDYDQSDLTG
jgi:hypothetical protein